VGSDVTFFLLGLEEGVAVVGLDDGSLVGFSVADGGQTDLSYFNVANLCPLQRSDRRTRSTSNSV